MLVYSEFLVKIKIEILIIDRLVDPVKNILFFLNIFMELVNIINKPKCWTG